MSMGQLHWQSSVAHDANLKFIRAFYPAGFAFPLHTHDFFEVSIVESGQGFHTCNGHESPLRENDIFFVHSSDEHAVRAAPDSAVHFVNLIIAADTVERIRSRHAPQAPGPWPWSTGSGARLVRLDPEDRAWLSGWCRELERTDQATDLLSVEVFITDLWRRVARTGIASSRSTAPTWLSDALEALEDPRLLAEGIPALVRLTDRCREHLGRLMTQHVGCSTVAYLARRRMAYAARQLLGSSTLPIADIAHRCGYDSISHFHAKFRAFHHCTPEAYRRNGHDSPPVA